MRRREPTTITGDLGLRLPALTARSRFDVRRRCRRRRMLVGPALLLFLASGEAIAADPPEPPVVILSPPPPEPAPDEDPSPPPEPEPRAGGRFETSLGGLVFPSALGSASFTGSGVPIGQEKRTSFSARGREIGLRSPTFVGGELGIGYRDTYFGVIVSGFLARNAGTDSTPTNPQAAAQAGAGNVTAYGGGIEAFAALPLGRFTLSAGVLAGLRAFSIPLVGFEPTTCTTSSRRGRRRYPCAETATTSVMPYVQPRLHLDVAVDDRRSIFVGGYLGADALGEMALLGGVQVGLRR
jgi:hypothetical protein